MKRPPGLEISGGSCLLFVATALDRGSPCCSRRNPSGRMDGEAAGWARRDAVPHEARDITKWNNHLVYSDES